MKRAFSRVRTIPYESTFLLFNSDDTTIYQYNDDEEEFHPMPVNMSKPLDGATPIVVDLDIFPICRGDAAMVSWMEKRSEALLVEGTLAKIHGGGSQSWAWLTSNCGFPGC